MRENGKAFMVKIRRVIYPYGLGCLIGMLAVTLILLVPIYGGRNGLDVLQEFFESNDSDDIDVVGDDPFQNSSSLGYELLDDGSVFHMWNQYNSYYFNVSNGIQFSNHYLEYWTTNVLMLGYYDGEEWNLIYRTDELSGFNKNITGETDDYINATLWKDLSYGSYDFRLALRYHLAVNDSDLTVVPYIKNLGIEIPYVLGFGWELKDIQIDCTEERDWIRINRTEYLLNQTLDEKYTNLSYVTQNLTGDNITVHNTQFTLIGRNEGKYFTRTLYLRWNHTLDYFVWVKNRTGQYNAPVTLFIKVGTLDVGQ